MTWQPTRTGLPRRITANRITRPGSSAPGKLWSTLWKLFGIPQDVHQKATNEHGIALFGHAEIAALAYELWQARGCPEGSSEKDWFDAAEQLRSRR